MRVCRQMPPNAELSCWLLPSRSVGGGSATQLTYLRSIVGSANIIEYPEISFQGGIAILGVAYSIRTGPFGGQNAG